MAKISISEAARLTGKNRTTLHRHIKSGKLSKFLDNDNAPLLDTSELMRVYPTFKAPVAVQQVAGVLQSNSKQQLATGDATAEIELLKLKLQHAEEKIAIEEVRRHESERREREAKEEVNRLLNIVEKHTYLLAAAPEQESVKKSWWQRVFN
jgi:Ca2+-binding EF-hand superfamily protein